MHGEQGQQPLCYREQDFVYRAIAKDRDLTGRVNGGVTSLRICLAADVSLRWGRPIRMFRRRCAKVSGNTPAAVDWWPLVSQRRLQGDFCQPIN